MTVSNTDRSTRASGDGFTTTFSFSFPVFNESDIEVYKIDTTTTPETANLQNEPADYTVSLNTISEGGSITYTTAPTTDEDSFIIRKLDYTQEVAIRTNTNFDEENLEDALDKITMLTIQLQEENDRTLLVNEFYDGSADFTIPNPEASKVIGWDSTGLQMANYSGSDLDTILTSSYGQQLVQSADAETARNVLELGTTDNVQFAQITGTSYVGLPDATETVKGVAELATSAEALTGTDDTKIMTPLKSAELRGLEIVDEATISNDATVEFTWTDTDIYDHLFVFEDVLPVNDATELRGRISIDGGSTWKQGASDYQHAVEAFNSGGSYDAHWSLATTSMAFTADISGFELGNESEKGYSGQIILFAPNKATTYKKLSVVASFTGDAAGNDIVKATGGCQYDGSTAIVNGIQFFMDSGNISSGVIKHYRYK